MNKYTAERDIKQIVGSPCEVFQMGADVEVMWEDTSLTFAHLAAISELFGTEAIDIRNEAMPGGCDTCDYGTGVITTLTVRGVDLD